MRAQTQLALLQQLRQRQNLVRKGFTLVELMIVVAIIGLLSAVALPQFLNARDRADVKAKIGETVGLAKECAVFSAEADSGVSYVKYPRGGSVDCGKTNTAVRSFSSRAFPVGMVVDCVDQKSLTTTTAGITITVTTEGQMSCDVTP